MTYKSTIRSSSMSRRLRFYMLLTDIGLLTYWVLISLAALGFFSIPADIMYSDASNPTVIVWNWSFLPLDVILSVLGLVSVRMARKNDERWLGLAIISLTLTFCAGFMALSFWAIRGDFDISWWGLNLFLVLGPLLFSSELLRSVKVNGAASSQD